MPKVYEAETGTYTGDGLAKALVLGFNPRYFKLINITDRIVDEKTDSMLTNVNLNIAAAGTQTSATNLTFSATGVSIAAGANVNAKVYHYLALGGL